MNNLLEKALKRADAAEVFLRTTRPTQISSLGDAVTAADTQDRHEVLLRLGVGRQVGSAVASSLDDVGVVDRALASLVPGEMKAELCGPPLVRTPVECYDKALVDLTPGDMADISREISKMVDRAIPGLKADVQVYKEEGRVGLANSVGFTDQFVATRYRVAVTTKNNLGFTEVSRRVQSSRLVDFTPGLVETLLQLHRAGENVGTVKSGKMPVVFSGKAMGALMWRLLAGVNSGNVLLGTSPLANKMGEKIAAAHLTVRDDPTQPWGWATRPFDDRGVPSSETLLVEDGVLRRYLASPADAAKLAVEPTANSFKRTPFSRDIEDPYSIDGTNLLLSGDTCSDKELMLKAGRGIYVQSVMGAHTGNIVAGDYALPVSRGYVIEGGRIVAKLKDAIVSGNIYKDLFNMLSLGSLPEPLEAIDQQYGDCPAVLFSEISVVGE